MSDFRIVTDKTLVDTALLLKNEPHLPEAVRQLNLCEAFAGVSGGENISVALLAKRKGVFDIVNLGAKDSPAGQGAEKETLAYLLDYIRAQGGGPVEIGGAADDTARYAMLLNLGFRLVGIWKDKLPPNTAKVPAGVDMIRFRLTV